MKSKSRATPKKSGSTTTSRVAKKSSTPSAQKQPAKKQPAKKSVARKAKSSAGVAGGAGRDEDAPVAPAAASGTRADAGSGDVTHEQLRPDGGAEDRGAPTADAFFDDDWADLGWDEPDPVVRDAASDDGQPRREGSLPDGVELFQAAARDLIDAARSMLDVAADVIEDPAAIGAALQTVRSMTSEVLRSATRHGAAGRGPDASDPDDDASFQRIDLD
ncbi:MAG TPA: hypothetical protein VFN21_02560 [Acidimicrobiales bacterium]|nr:hypothetical protein [Acidimicrobiales bacterium]